MKQGQLTAKQLGPHLGASPCLPTSCIWMTDSDTLNMGGDNGGCIGCTSIVKMLQSLLSQLLVSASGIHMQHRIPQSAAGRLSDSGWTLNKSWCFASSLCPPGSTMRLGHVLPFHGFDHLLFHSHPSATTTAQNHKR